jgi:hypothetical protein
MVLVRASSGLAAIVLALVGVPSATTAQDEGFERLIGVWEGLSRVSMLPARTTRFPAVPPFTPEGALVFGTVDRTRDPVTEDCWPPGPVRFMPEDGSRTDDVPMEIVRALDGLEIVNPKYPVRRRIYLDADGRRPLPGEVNAFMGRSVGRWEGRALVVETDSLNDKTWLSERGLPHSDEMRLVERFSVLPIDVLELEMTVIDPRFYRAPLVVTRLYRRTDRELPEAGARA